LAYPEQRTTSLKGCLIVSLLMVGSTVLCIFFGYVTADVLCVRHADPWMVDYPDAEVEVITQEHSFLRPWGIGATTRVIRVYEDPRVVRQWYRDRHFALDASGTDTQGIGTIRLARTSNGPNDETAIVRMGTRCTMALDFTR